MICWHISMNKLQLLDSILTSYQDRNIKSFGHICEGVSVSGNGNV